MQRASMQFFKPENWFTVRQALIETGRQNLIGNELGPLLGMIRTEELLAARRLDGGRPLPAGVAGVAVRHTGRR